MDITGGKMHFVGGPFTHKTTYVCVEVQNGQLVQVAGGVLNTCSVSVVSTDGETAGSISEQTIDSSGYENVYQKNYTPTIVNNVASFNSNWDEVPGMHFFVTDATVSGCKPGITSKKSVNRARVRSIHVEMLLGAQDLHEGKTTANQSNTFVVANGQAGCYALDTYDYTSNIPGMGLKFRIFPRNLDEPYTGNVGTIGVWASYYNSLYYDVGANDYRGYRTTYPTPLPTPLLEPPDILNWNSNVGQSLPWSDYQSFSNGQFASVSYTASPYYEFDTTMSDFSVRETYVVYLMVRVAFAGRTGFFVPIFNVWWNWGCFATWSGGVPSLANPVDPNWNSDNKPSSFDIPRWSYSSEYFIDSTSHKMNFLKIQDNSVAANIGWMGNPLP